MRLVLISTWREGGKYSPLARKMIGCEIAGRDDGGDTYRTGKAFSGERCAGCARPVRHGWRKDLDAAVIYCAECTSISVRRVAV